MSKEERKTQTVRFGRYVAMGQDPGVDRRIHNSIGRGTYTWMLSEDVAHVIPYGGGDDVPHVEMKSQEGGKGSAVDGSGAGP